MNTKIFTVCCIAVATLPVAIASAREGDVMSSPPIIGDYQKASAHLRLGRNAMASKSWTEAKTEFMLALKSCPFDEDAHLGLARCAMAQGDPKEAVAQYSHAVRGNDTNLSILVEYGLALVDAGEMQRAIKNYNDALSLCRKGYCLYAMDIVPADMNPDGTDYDARAMVATLHVIRAMNTGFDRMDTRTSELDAAIAADPNSSLAYYYKGVLLQLGKQPGAEAAFQKALSLDDGANTALIGKRMPPTSR